MTVDHPDPVTSVPRIARHPTLRQRLRRTKAALLAASLTLAGVLLIMLNSWVSAMDLGSWSWLHALPIGELGGTLFGAGVLGTLFEFSFRKDQEESTVEQFRDIIREQAPAMRDAVVDGFAIHPEDLKRVANPQLLDDIATNVMALRLGDEQFARELYADLRDQIIGAAERWYDVEISIRLSRALERSTSGAPLFDVLVQAEYTTTPTSPIRRFAVVSDRAEFNELRQEAPRTAVWLITPRTGVDPTSRESFELLELLIDGVQRPVRRSQRKTGQIYTVDLGGLPGGDVRVRQTYRTVTLQSGHRLFVELPVPARGVSVSLDFTGAGIARLSVTDTIATLKPAQITTLPEGAHGREVAADVPGWLLPKSGFAFTWTLDAELPRSERSEAA